jgi:hypothetical protein
VLGERDADGQGWCGAVLACEVVRLCEQPLGRVAVADAGMGVGGADGAQRACVRTSARRAQPHFGDPDRAVEVRPLGLPGTSPCDEVGVVDLARQVQRMLQQRGASAGVTGVFAQPAGVQRPARLYAHQRAAKAAGCDLAVCGDEMQFAARGREHLLGVVGGVVRADDRQQPFPVISKPGIDMTG